jgi:hypothetical protein
MHAYVGAHTRAVHAPTRTRACAVCFLTRAQAKAAEVHAQALELAAKLPMEQLRRQASEAHGAVQDFVGKVRYWLSNEWV